MNTTDLTNKKVAILATDGYEQSELESPRLALEDAGAETFIVALDIGEITAWDGEEKDWGDREDVDYTVNEVTSDDFDALLLPGGVMNPDQLRMSKEAVELVRGFFHSGKPVGAICHGPQILIDADVVRGKSMTSYPSIKNDLINAGAYWVDEEVVVDNGLITSRTPDDLPAFNAKLIEEVAEGIHEGREMTSSGRVDFPEGASLREADLA
jgi:protease I